MPRKNSSQKPACADDNIPKKNILSAFEKAELKKTYRRLAKIYHPDTASGAQEKEFLTARMSAINEAFKAMDAQTLMRYLRKAEAEIGTCGHSSLKRLEYLKIDEMILDELTASYVGRVNNLKKSSTYKTMRDAREHAKRGADFFAGIEQELKDKIESYKRILKVLEPATLGKMK